MSRPFRYTFILGLVALATGLAAVGGWRYARASAPVNGPIILISIDGLRTDHLPVYGYGKVRTPAIDTLAADGVVFERAYSHTPQTLPAHVSLLSGRLPFETGVRDNVGFVVKDEERLLPEMLRDRGFATAAVVSTYVLRKETGIGQGFTFFDAEMPPASPDSALGELRRSGQASEAIAERWLDHVDTQRLFLFLHLYEPHAPHLTDRRFAEYSPYDAQVASADDAVGRLIRYLKAHQLYDRSTIILVSDHGEGLGDHGEEGDGLFVYEEALRVPLIIKQAAAEGAGRRVADLVQHVDVVPTILDLAKAPVSSRLSGRSLKPLLDGSGTLNRRMVYSESLYARYHFGWSELTSITDGRYRYIRAPREELYDLQSDPEERDNLAETAPADIIDPLRHDLKQFGAGVAVPPQTAVSAEQREHLDALGYVGGGADSTAWNDPTAAPLDPKDRYPVVETYRAAVRLGVSRKWSEAMDLLRVALRTEPGRTDLWGQLARFATQAGRDDQAAAAYKRILALEPDAAGARLGAATALLRRQRLEEARHQAALVARPDSGSSRREQAAAHAVLAEIALARRDPASARDEAALVCEADPTQPMPDFVEARLLYAQGRLIDSLPIFEKAVEELSRLHGPPIAGLHFYAGDALSRLKRYPEAEREFLEELTYFPQDSRTRAALAIVYQNTGRPGEAGEAISALTRISPTPGTYQLAARLWETFAEPRRAAAVRAEAHRLFESTQPRPASRPAQ